MVIYTENNKVTLVQSVASTATMISSLTGEIRDYVITKFPKGFFKSFNINTSEFVHMKGQNDRTSRTANKIKLPNISMAPRLTLDDPIAGMEKNYLMSDPNMFIRRDMSRQYNKVMVDPEGRYGVFYTADFITVNFDFELTTNKFIQHANLLYYIKSRFQIAMFRYLNDANISVEIPKTFMHIIAALEDKNLEIDPIDYTHEETFESLKEYVASISTTPDIIKIKTDNQTGKLTFFMNNKQNILTVVDDLTGTESMDRDAMVEGTYTVNFRVQASLWLPNNFIMSIDRDKLADLDKKMLSEISVNQASGQGMFYTMSIPNLILRPQDSIYFPDAKGDPIIGQRVAGGLRTFEYREFTPSIIRLMPDMKDDFKRVHAYMVSRDLDLRNLFTVQVWDNNGLKDSSEYEFDHKEMTVVINDTRSDIATYVYVNRVAFEAMQKSMMEEDEFFNNNGIAIIEIAYTGVEDPIMYPDSELEQDTFKVRVYGFRKKEDYAKDFVKVGNRTMPTALRMMTNYGVGFIGLVPVDHPRATDYRTSIGIDKNGKPIIMAFEKI